MDNVDRYRIDISRFKSSAGDRQTLIMRAYDGDEAAMRELTTSLLWLPFTLAARHYHTGSPSDLDDLIQTCNIALLTAIRSWNPTGGAKLTTWIRWGCQRDMARADASTHVVRFSTYEMSYDTTEPYEDEEHEGASVEERLWENEQEVLSAVAGLEPDLSDVITQLYIQGKSLREVADNMKKSHTHVARLRDTGLSTLREQL
jgi:RNA polymerase sigma factor (sigma-70 family)